MRKLALWLARRLYQIATDDVHKAAMHDLKTQAARYKAECDALKIRVAVLETKMAMRWLK